MHEYTIILAPPQLASNGVCLESTFDGFPLHSVCVLLRLLYWPEEGCDANLGQLELATTLPDVVRQAHMLDGPALLAKLDRHLTAAGERCSKSKLLLLLL